MRPTRAISAVYVDLHAAQDTERHVDRSQVIGKILVPTQQCLVDEAADQFRGRGSLRSRPGGERSPLLIGEVDVGAVHTPIINRSSNGWYLRRSRRNRSRGMRRGVELIVQRPFLSVAQFPEHPQTVSSHQIARSSR